MLAHFGSNTASSRTFCNQVTAISHMRTQGWLIRFNVIAANDVPCFVFCDVGAFCNVNPHVVRLARGHVHSIGIRLTDADDGLHEFPDLRPVFFLEFANVDHSALCAPRSDL